MSASTDNPCATCTDRECYRTKKPCRALENTVSNRGKGRSVRTIPLPGVIERATQGEACRPDLSRKLRADCEACWHLFTPNQRRIVPLRFFEGLSVSEIAAEVNRSVSTVSETLARIMKVLEEYRRHGDAGQGKHKESGEGPEDDGTDMAPVP